MMAVVVPDGVAPGGLFNIQTPSGAMMAVTCPMNAAAGQQIQVAVPEPAKADPSVAIAKLVDGFVLGKVTGQSMAPGDGTPLLGGMLSVHGMIAQQQLTDLEGNTIATVHYSSNNLEYGQRSACITAADSTVLATLDKPKMQLIGSGFTARPDYQNPANHTHTILINGVPYADVLLTIAQSPTGHLPCTLTRKDGSGGLQTGERISNQGWYMCMAFLLWVPTLAIGSCFFFYLMYISPVIVGLKSLDGASTYVPILGLKNKQTLAFSAAAIPLKLAKPAQKYLKAKSPASLEGGHRLDALLLLVVQTAAMTLNNSD